MPRRRRPRHWARDEIAALDPERDYERITHLCMEVRYGDPVLTAALYTVAFCRQMSVPSIAAVVHRGGRSPIIQTTRRRNDETLAFFGEFMRHGPSSAEGRASIGRLNRIHSRFPITNEQSLYTLASLTFESERIPSLLGLDPLSAGEKRANFLFWAAVGREMGLTDMPADAESFWAWTVDYERAEWAHTEGGEAVARAMLEDYARRWLPRRASRIGRELVPAMMEPELLDTLHLKHPRPFTRRAVALATAGYFKGRQLLPDPPDRSWYDDFAGGPGAPRPGP